MILLLSIETGLHFMSYFIKIFFSAQFATLYFSCSKHSMNMSFWVNFDKITILVFPMDLQNRPIYSKRNVSWSPNWDIFVLQIIYRSTAIFWNNKPSHFNLVKKTGNELGIWICGCRYILESSASQTSGCTLVWSFYSKLRVE